MAALQDTGNVETAIKEAETACADGTAGECAAAWDSVSCGICRLRAPLHTAVTPALCLKGLALQVEELSAAAAHRKVAQVCAG